MFGINPNYKNLAENLILFIVTNTLTAIIVYNTCSKTNINTSEAIIKKLIPTIEKAIDKETIANDIVNKIEVKVDKIKKSDSLHINVNQEPNNNQKPKNAIIKTSVKKEKDSIEKSWLGKVFSKKKYKKIK